MFCPSHTLHTYSYISFKLSHSHCFNLFSIFLSVSPFLSLFSYFIYTSWRFSPILLMWLKYKIVTHSLLSSFLLSLPLFPCICYLNVYTNKQSIQSVYFFIILLIKFVNYTFVLMSLFNGYDIHRGRSLSYRCVRTQCQEILMREIRFMNHVQYACSILPTYDVFKSRHTNFLKVLLLNFSNSGNHNARNSQNIDWLHFSK